MKGKGQGQAFLKEGSKENTGQKTIPTKGPHNSQKIKKEPMITEKKSKKTDRSPARIPIQSQNLDKKVISGSPKFGGRKGRLEPLSKTQVEVLTKSQTSKPQDRVLKPLAKNLPKISSSTLQNPTKPTKFGSNTETLKRPSSLNDNSNQRTTDIKKISQIERKNTKVTQINEENESNSSNDDEEEAELIEQKPKKKLIIGKNAPTFEEWKRRNGFSLTQKVTLVQ